jgi:phosphoesterase RecJ-like protein
MNDRDRNFIADAAARLKPLIDGARTVALLTHVTPDGDGIGAEICLHGYLTSRGIETRILNTEPIPPRYAFLDTRGAVEVFDPARHDAFVRQADLIFMLDNSAVSRLGTVEAATRASRATTVCIDHHNLIEPFWKVNIVDAEASATGELVFQIIKALGGKPDFASAQAAYVSLVTDTGYFRFGKTSPRAHVAAAEMLACGVSPPKVYEEVFERNSVALIRLGGIALGALSTGEEGRLAWITLTHAQVTGCGAESEDTSDIVNDLLAIDRVRVAVLLKDLGGDRVKLSFRSKGPLDVNRIAQSFGGGGHTNAAGAVIPGRLQDLIEPVLAPCRELLRRTA